VIVTPQTTVIVGGTKQKASVSAIIDTGFNGDIFIPVEVAVTLGLELVAMDEVRLADGIDRQEVLFAGTVDLLGETRDVFVSLTAGDVALVGTELLADCRLAIDFATGDVQLTKSKGRRRR
jgi:clan AA aspartic protease